ncbi:MAG: alpha/beta hydrolase [Candidatus Eisenbacteria bacterium]
MTSERPRRRLRGRPGPPAGTALVALFLIASARAQSPGAPALPGQPGQPARPAQPALPQRPSTPWAAGPGEPERRQRVQPTFEQMIRMPAVLRMPGEDSAVVRRDLTYRTIAGKALRFDLYLPPGTVSPRGAIVFASGGSDTREWAIYQSYGRLAAAHGLAGVVYEKRYERSQVLDGVADTEALLDHLRDRGASLGVDPSRLVLWGFSAGGKLLGTGINPRRQEVRALIGFYPVLDLAAELRLYPDSLRARAKNSASPSDMLEARPVALPPTLIVRAGLDSPGLNSGIARFVRIALDANRTIELINVAEGRHGFDQLDDTEESRRAIRRAFAFAREHVGAR